MQQTEKYKLNLIEREDVFSPEALNENTRKVEAALETKAGAALEGRVAALEAHHIYVGSYDGSSKAQTIQLPFTPLAVFVYTFMAGTTRATFRTPTGTNNGLSIVEGGFIDSGSTDLTQRTFLALC